MFFYLGNNNCRDELLYSQQYGLYTDLGWKQQDDVYYKGYCLDYDIHLNVDRILSGDKPQGIYCLIQDNKLFYPEMRPFPLYQQGEALTNLRLENFSELENTRYKLPTTSKTLHEVVSNVVNIVVDNLSKFELNIWCTGGIDSMMLVALAEYAKLPYTIHITRPRAVFQDIRQWEGTVQEYQSPLLDFCRKNYWAYEFLSNFNDKIITTGFYGDEYFCRTIWQIHTLLNGRNLLDVIKSTDYVYKHITKDKYQHLNVTNTVEDAKFIAMRSIGTNHVWHLDNTLTFCPLMDKRIVDNVWSLSEETLLACAVDATIQKEIIKKTTPDVLLLTDNYKNSFDGRKNFFTNIQKVKLSSCKNIVIH